MNKNKLIIVIVLLLSFILTGCSSLKVDEKYIYDDSNYSFGNMSFEETINEIKVDWLVGDIIIQKSENEELIIREDTDANIQDEYKMHYLLAEDSLDIKFAGSFEKLTYNFKVKKLYIYLPAKINEIIINSVASDVDVNYVTIDSLNIKSVSGDVNIVNTQVGELQISSVSSEIMIFDSELKTASLTTISGDIGFKYNNPLEQLNITTVDGNILIYISEETPFGAKFNSTTGKFISNLSYNKEDKIYIFNNANVIYDVTTVSGDLKILKK